MLIFKLKSLCLTDYHNKCHMLSSDTEKESSFYHHHCHQYHHQHHKKGCLTAALFSNTSFYLSFCFYTLPCDNMNSNAARQHLKNATQTLFFSNAYQRCFIMLSKSLRVSLLSSLTFESVLVLEDLTCFLYKNTCIVYF